MRYNRGSSRICFGSLGTNKEFSKENYQIRAQNSKKNIFYNLGREHRVLGRPQRKISLRKKALGVS